MMKESIIKEDKLPRIRSKNYEVKSLMKSWYIIMNNSEVQFRTGCGMAVEEQNRLQANDYE